MPKFGDFEDDRPPEEIVVRGIKFSGVSKRSLEQSRLSREAEADAELARFLAGERHKAKFLSFGGGSRSFTRPENEGLGDRVRKDIELENDRTSWGGGLRHIIYKIRRAHGYKDER